MRLKMLCIEEEVTSYSVKGVTYNPLALTLQDVSPDPMKELVEFRIRDPEEKAKWAGKGKGHLLELIVRRVTKANGVAGFEGTLVGVADAVKK